MDTKENGGPAFPVHVEVMSDCFGMTLRDYTAIEAGAKLFAEYSLHQIDRRLCDGIAHAAFVFADAMLAERAK